MVTRRGFTIIELSLVVSIMGFLTLVVSSEVAQFAQRAKRASCIMNQRKIHEASILYGIEQNPGNAVVNAQQLWMAELIQQRGAECPNSNILDFDDYTLTFISSELSLITCDIKGALHPYVP